MRREKGAGKNEGIGDPQPQHGENNREEFLNELQSYYPPPQGKKEETGTARGYQNSPNTASLMCKALQFRQQDEKLEANEDQSGALGSKVGFETCGKGVLARTGTFQPGFFGS